eukprot:CAMPEP_0175017244 /NCGR_PEP_ID=MMETSP0005-20121125/12284_1 /TAXON_ID=420556 /ORGANISM="Ochromonas sp., Strain CCMP1393" /LENGTH=323 /DNA_ID=CAMNT_0016274625 /DNA_START=270 /DNA_END=1239 /DNA_ORIENTATION=+
MSTNTKKKNSNNQTPRRQKQSEEEQEEEYNVITHFKGYLLGNPFTSYTSGSRAMLQVMWGLQLVPYPEWKAFTTLGCADWNLTVYDLIIDKPYCFDLMDDFDQYIDHLNPYALEYPVCTSDYSNSVTDFNFTRPLGRTTTTTTTTTAGINTDTIAKRDTDVAPDATREEGGGLRPRQLSAQGVMLRRLSDRMKALPEYVLYKQQQQQQQQRQQEAMVVEEEIKLNERTGATAASTDADADADAIPVALSLSLFPLVDPINGPRRRPMPSGYRKNSSSHNGGKSGRSKSRDYTTEYLSDPAVQQAIHVALDHKKPPYHPDNLQE